MHDFRANKPRSAVCPLLTATDWNRIGDICHSVIDSAPSVIMHGLIISVIKTICNRENCVYGWLN